MPIMHPMMFLLYWHRATTPVYARGREEERIHDAVPDARAAG